MSFLNPSGDLHNIEEVLPAGMKTGLSQSSLLLQRKRVKVVPQGGQTLGTPSTSAAGGAGNRQLSFLLSGNGGLIDPSSAVLNYYVSVTGTTGPVCVDDGHPLGIVNVLLGGQPLEQITNAARLTNMEMTLGGSKAYYQTAGSLQGFYLLNNDLINTLPVAGTGSVIASEGQYGYVSANINPANQRQVKAASVQTGNQFVGEQRSIPLSLISGFFRCKQYIPDMLGDLTLIASTLSAPEYVFNAGASVTGDYALDGISIEYDVVFPNPAYTAVLRNVMTAPNDALMIAYESAIVSTGAVVNKSETAIKESTLIVSRATSNLVRTSLVFISSAGQSSLVFPGQSCFAHAGVSSAIIRVGSSTYPNFPAYGDASMFSMSLAAYGSPANENGSITNRALWAQSTKFGSSGGTPTSLETATSVFTGGSTSDVKFAYGDRFCLAYGFRNAKGDADEVDLDGLNMSQASGAQLQWVIQSAPCEDYQPYVALTAIRVIKCSGGAVSIVGA
jgi:hypothetical protein